MAASLISVQPPVDVHETPGRGLIDPDLTYGQVSDRLTRVPRQPLNRWWLLAFGFFGLFTMLMMIAISWELTKGVGVWGVNIPTAWGFAIVDFVWWIGIGHAGTLISAFLLLMRQNWRNSINRITEGMTLFAVINAGLFPVLHLGRQWKFYWIFPYPNSLGTWPQWRSALVWDGFAVSTYFIVSLLFWYAGLMPDLATLRDTAKNVWVRRFSGIFALGWRNSAKHWQRHQMLYLLLAGLATPLVVSVHSIVSLDFAIASLPGWNETIFPPYFVAGAIYSGFGMVFTLIIPMRKIFGWEDLITIRHLNVAAKVTLVSELVVGYSYCMEFFTAWYSSDPMEWDHMVYLVTGAYMPVTIIVFSCNVLFPQLLWSYRVRTSPLALFIMSIIINIGMWTERYFIVIGSLYRDYMPSAWKIFHGTPWDWLILAGTVGFFFFLMTMLTKLIPIVPISESRELLHEAQEFREKRLREKHRQTGGGGELSEEEIEREAPDPARPLDPPRTQPLAVPARELSDDRLYGYTAEFDNADDLVAAAKQVRDAGYKRIDGYAPYPVKELPDALGFKKSWVAAIVLLGAAVGACSAYAMMYWAAVWDYPWNIGGRPFHSWPSFIPITFECAVLGGSLFGFFGLLLLNKFPALYHPVMNAPDFDRASRDRFFLCIEKIDKQFDREETASFLCSTQPVPVRVSEVPTK